MSFSITTPHAAIKIWNYNDRIAYFGSTKDKANKVDEIIISTVSLINIQTAKSKSDPAGTFNFSLAPTRNWVSVLTPGSWCVILISNEPITEQAFTKADKSFVKMFGRIESVRTEVSVDAEGARQTRYLVSGQDWGSIFNNIFYVDKLIGSPDDPNKSQSNAFYQQLVKNLLGKNNTPDRFRIRDNLRTLLKVHGESLQDQLPIVDRIPAATHNIKIPQEAVDFFGFVNWQGTAINYRNLSTIISLQTGALRGKKDGIYNQVDDGAGWLDPFTMVGSHTLWSILMDNCNHALNEMYSDFRWYDKDKPELMLYSRIKPFSYRDSDSGFAKADRVRSQFRKITTHKLDSSTVTSINAGTNWRDKYNFAEIKPNLSDLQLQDGTIKFKAQAYQKTQDGKAVITVFDREGFRPIIFSISQLPTTFKGEDQSPIDKELFESWATILQEWYFDSHRLLNGRIDMTGISEYLPIGDNILFEAELIGIAPNYNSASAAATTKIFVLAHVESVQHVFSVDQSGTRQFQTIIQFVRGIIVDEQKNLIGEGTIDNLTENFSTRESRNDITVIDNKTDDNPKDEN